MGTSCLVKNNKKTAENQDEQEKTRGVAYCIKNKLRLSGSVAYMKDQRGKQKVGKTLTNASVITACAMRK